MRIDGDAPMRRRGDSFGRLADRLVAWLTAPFMPGLVGGNLAPCVATSAEMAHRDLVRETSIDPALIRRLGMLREEPSPIAPPVTRSVAKPTDAPAPSPTANPTAASPLAQRLARRAGRPPLVYFVNQYPAVTHTFIRREIAALETLGFEVIPVSARHGPNLVDAADLAERQRTQELLASGGELARSVLSCALRHPLGLARAAGLTLAMMSRRSDRSPLHHLAYLAEACALAAIMARTRAAHVHAHFGTNPAEIAMLAAAIAGKSYSFTVHGYDEYDKPEFLGLKLKIARARFVAAVSHYGRSQLLRWCALEDRGKIHLVRCGLDHDEMNAAEQAGPDPASPAPIPASRRLVCVGRLCREKGQETLIEAASLLRARGVDCELVLVGDGPTRGLVEAAIAREGLGDRVVLTGWRDGPGVRREMLASRALVSASFAENLPVVMMEAMALGRPVIGTMIAGVPELVLPGETGWLAPAGSVEALADAMQTCLEASEATIAAMGARGRELARRQHDALTEARVLAELLP